MVPEARDDRGTTSRRSGVRLNARLQDPTRTRRVDCNESMLHAIYNSHEKASNPPDGKLSAGESFRD